MEVKVDSIEMLGAATRLPFCPGAKGPKVCYVSAVLIDLFAKKFAITNPQIGGIGLG